MFVCLLPSDPVQFIHQILSITSIQAILFNIWDHRENIDIGTMQSTVKQGFLDLLMMNLGLWSSDALSENLLLLVSQAPYCDR